MITFRTSPVQRSYLEQRATKLANDLFRGHGADAAISVLVSALVAVVHHVDDDPGTVLRDAADACDAMEARLAAERGQRQ